MIKLCILDMDGTLIDSEKEVWLKGKKKLMKEKGYEYDEEYFSALIGFTHKDMSIKLDEHFGKDFDGNDFMNRLFQYYVDTVNGNVTIPLKKGAIELLDYLKANNIKISLGTSTARKYVEMIFSNLNIADYFDYMVCGDEVINGKPNPEIFNKSQEYFGFKKEECLVIEDSVPGLKTATSANMKCIIIKDIYPYKPHDLDDAYYIADDLAKVIPQIEKINKEG